ncbi:Tripeptidyl-peptidase II protein [Dioscorea alata]|uniref:Tripeptidyl-peptidase II protein n=1 Tax=Dioscorea alata TaxID=55571 RepID=A0ACB7WSA2_DIOAL|nr:Tripeptidyl-peptidase II protein [Dioscorea alata]
MVINHSSLLLLFFFSTLFIIPINSQLLSPIIHCSDTSGDRNTYIIHVETANATKFLAREARERYYRSFLQPLSSSGEQLMLYSYMHAINGFAARLTEAEVKTMMKMKGFVHAQKDHEYNLHTTHSPDFLGLQQDHCFWKESNYGKGVIIGVLDTGVMPNHQSFTGEDMPLPPAKWKGICDFDIPVCNNKLVGARGFLRGCRNSPVDDNGHGMHTASIAAGNFVANASVLGQAKGNASGIAPKAHLAVYKVCYKHCHGSDILAAIDQAISDGVDVLSISIGGRPDPFYDDHMAIGALAAVEKGLFVSSSAGNMGPKESSVENNAPWMLTVGASTMDRSIRVTIKLGNGEEINGESAYQPDNFPFTMLPLIFPGEKGVVRAKTCSDGSLDGINVRGKIVLCETGGGVNNSIEKGMVVKNAGGIAMILMNQGKQMLTVKARAHVLPAAQISYGDSLRIKKYMKASPVATAGILFKGTVYGTPVSPSIASFSGRGPSVINNGVMKPDIVGPGLNILAAWPSSADCSAMPTFNMLSGTSMAAPHLAGVAALLKASHPDWSPAMIKSAIMTTADELRQDGKLISDETGNSTNYFAMGAGHVNPSKANDPGLVYDINIDDYISYLCGLGYSDRQVSAVARRYIECLSRKAITAEELNYPTFTVSVASESQKTVTRTVKNVGENNAVYTVQVDAPEGVKVDVYPEKIEFSEINETVVYDVYFTSGDSSERIGSVSEGQLRWVSGKHVVKSAITVSFV